ncbi:MAG TPA: hypothetical protein VMV07_21855 [Streptosporangiaceae bacterium]|nr:hypothetical protein [Streptosporangiaceae bacterium]
MIACLLDDSALLALGKGYPALSGFIVDAAAGRAVVAVPALCLCAAEALRPGIAEHVGRLPVDIEPLELSAAIPAGRLIGDGVDWRIAHAVAAALPSAVHPDGRVILSVETARYEGSGVRPIDPGDLG